MIYSQLNFDTMSSKNGISYDDLIPKKLRSPPPKPPRRRHSDQSSTFSCSPFVCNKSEQLNGNHNLNTEASNITSSSGSESLPSNWISESPIIEKLKDKEPEGEMDSNFAQRKENSAILSVGNDVCTDFLVPENTNELHNSTSYKPNKQLSMENSESHLLNYLLRNESSCICGLNSHICLKKHLSEKGNELYYEHHNDPLTSETFATISSIPSAQSLLENISVSVKDLRLKTSMGKDVHSSEAKIQKEINDKLWQHLCLLQAKLDEFQLSQMSLEDDNESNISFSELMVDIYKAQKEKDTALENRLNSALRLRDTAIKELEAVLQILVRSFEDTDSCKNISKNTEELENFFQDLESMEHPVDILQKQHILLAYLYQVKENKIQYLSDAVKVAEEERDKAILKVRSLEKEISDLRRSSSVISSDESTVFRIVDQDEFDFAKPLQGQIICHCSQRKLKGEMHSTNLISPFCDNCYAFINESYLSWIDSMEDMELLKAELKSLSKLCKAEVQKRQNAEGNCVKLRQTLNYLLEKFNGLNIGVPV